jgi:OFA family oxalate/formate antiporter-like MFS transporter
MFLLQAVLFLLIPIIGASYALLAILAIVIASCYGGGSARCLRLTPTHFGSANIGKIYGLILTAWGFGGVLGPLLISRVVDATGAYANAMYILAGLMVISTIVPLIIRPPRLLRSPGQALPVERRPERNEPE